MPCGGTSVILIDGMHGLGDNVYCRPFIRAATERHEVYLSTPWPELFDDLPLKFIDPKTTLRTQRKNVQAQASGRWHARPSQSSTRLFYGHDALTRHGSVIRAIESQLPLGASQFRFDLPQYKTKPVTSHNPIAIVRPVTVRREWKNTARNPRPEYLTRIASQLVRTHDVYVIADLADGEEWLEGDLPPHHFSILRGEVPIRDLITLVRSANIVVGGVGWIIPVCLATGTPLFVVFGGQGQHNAPHVVTDARVDLSNFGYAIPERFCKCHSMTHDCDKTIPDLAVQWNRFAWPRGLLSLPT